MRYMIRVLPLVGSALLFACASDPETSAKGPAVLDDYPTEDSAGLETQGQSERSLLEGQRLNSAADEPPQPRLLHFDFDRASVDAQYQQLLQQHAKFLRDNPDVRVRLEGHADERGTREYNMALGERRALNVQKSLLLLGATSSQLQSVSYGEEQPMVIGRDSQSFQQNRRVELVYDRATAGAGNAYSAQAATQQR